MNKIIISEYKSPIGILLLGSYKNRICICDWKFRKMRGQIDKRIMAGLNAEYSAGDSPVAAKLVKELDEYFAGKRKEFSVALLTAGTDFQKKVWKALMDVKYGQTESYLELASRIGNEKAARAAASANGANAISIIIPCHRITGSNGSPGGYAGGIPAKLSLLQLEKQSVPDL